VRDLVEKGLLIEWEDALTNPSMLLEGGLYQIGDSLSNFTWSVCLMNKSPTKLIFRSIEKHYQIGRLQFTIGLELVKKRVVGPDVVFESREEDAIAFLIENGSDVDDNNDGCSAERRLDGTTMEASTDLK
jgi:hypothetical protein